MSQKLTGKVAVVTGASEGNRRRDRQAPGRRGRGGRRQLLHPARKGPIASSPRSRSKGGKAVAVQANVAKPADIERLFAETKKAFGRLDILVNNAGIYEFAPLESVTAEHFHKQFDLNVLGLLLGDAGGGQALRRRRRQRSSTSARSWPRSRLPNASVYSATKAAVDAVTRSLAKELGPRKIRVNSINPGMVETEGVHARRHRRERLPQSRSKPKRRSAASASRRTSPRPPSSSPRPIRPGSPAKRSTSPAGCGDQRL